MLVLTGCDNPVIYTTDDGVTTIKEANVEITFDINNQRLVIKNLNWNYARIQIERLSDGSWLDIYNGSVGGGKTYEHTAYFQSGDQIAITIKIEGEEWYPFFTLP
ncbi:MAG: hypothetical protein PHS07_03560 [Patescibacteria group bacterium]|nr:hypothetical protein [Patescibacteria group bacterium]